MTRHDSSRCAMQTSSALVRTARVFRNARSCLALYSLRAEISGHGFGRCSILHRAGLELAEEWRLWLCGQRAAYARGHARSGLSGVSGGGFYCCGQSPRAVMLAQVVLDLATCFVIALIAARLAPERIAAARGAGRTVARGAVPVHGELHGRRAHRDSGHISDRCWPCWCCCETDVRRRASVRVPASGVASSPWFLGGIVAGFGTLVRPETPLLLVCCGIRAGREMVAARGLDETGARGAADGTRASCCRWCRGPRAIGARFHEVQFLAPRYSELPGEFTPLGFTAWTNTWLWRFRDVYLTQWKAERRRDPDRPTSRRGLRFARREGARGGSAR